MQQTLQYTPVLNKPATLKMTRIDVLALVSILLLAAALRFMSPQVIDYRQDQADLVSLAQDVVEGKSIPLLGIPSSAKIPNSPVTAYMIVIPYLFTDNPITATLFIAAFNVLGVALLWFLARRYFNATIAHIAALAYAVSPWAINYSRSIWAQDYYTPIFLIALLLGLYGFIEGKRWAQIWCLPVFFIAMQIHMAAIVLFPVYLWIVWVGRKNISKTALAISAVLALITVIPFIIGISQSLLSDPVSANSFGVQRREFSLREIIKPYGQMAWLMTGLGLEQYIARAKADEFINTIGIPTLHWIFLGLVTAVGVVASWIRFPRYLTILVMLWAFLPLAALTVPVLSVAPHYFVASIAALCLLAGIGSDWIISSIRQRDPNSKLHYAFVLLLGLVFVTQSIFMVRATDFIDRNYLPTQFGSGPSVHYLLNIQDELKSYEDVVLIGNGDWVDISAHGSPVWESLLRQSATCVRDIISTDGFVVMPATPFAAVYTPRTIENDMIDSFYQQGEPEVIELRPEEGSYIIYSHSAPTGWDEDLVALPEAVEFSNAVSLSDYQLDDGRLTLEWQLPEKTHLNYDYVVEYVDDSNEVIGQQKFPFWPGDNWCAGDRLISQASLEVPDGTQSMSINLQHGAEPLPTTGDVQAIINP